MPRKIEDPLVERKGKEIRAEYLRAQEKYQKDSPSELYEVI